MTKNLNAFQNFQGGFSISDAIQNRNLEREKIGILRDEVDFKKQQEEYKIKQEEAKRALAMEAFNNPEALKAVYGRDRELGESIAKERDKFNRISYGAIDNTLKATPTNQQEAWDNTRAHLTQRGIDVSDISAKYSPEVAKQLRAKQNELRTWDDTFKTIETAQGVQRLSEKTGEITPTGYGVHDKPSEGATGGVTGYEVRAIMKDHPGMTHTQALQLYQKGLREGTTIDEKGEMVVMPGKIKSTQDIKGAEKLAQNLGEVQAKQLGELETKANDAQDSLYSNNQTINLLNKGVLTGSGANLKLAFGKGLQSIGINYNDDPVANTETFIAQRASQVANKVKSFGAGTGISDADREYALAAAAGKISLNEKSIRKILEMDNKLSQYQINKYDTRRKRLSENLQNYLPDIKEESGKQKENKKSDYSDDDVNHTAKKYGISPEEVRRRLGK